MKYQKRFMVSFLLSILVVFGIYVSQAWAAPVVDGVGTDADWASAITQGDPANDVLPGPIETPTNDSGYDIVEARIYVDTSTNNLYFLLKTLGVPGDADGDGNPDASSVGAIRDYPGVGPGETYRIYLDCSNDGVIDHWVVITNNTGKVYDVRSGTPVEITTATVTWAIGNGSDDTQKYVEIMVNGTQICEPFIGAAGFTFQLEAISDSAFDGAPNDNVPDSGLIVVAPQLVASIDVEKSIDPSSAFPGEEATVEITVTNDGDLELCNVLVTDILPNCLTLAESDDDMDQDGIPDDIDDDDDDDGILDDVDDDEEGDGTSDLEEKDTDGDGVADKHDDDDDNDGISDMDDDDDNNDGILDVDDIDGDGIENSLDDDADGDGYADILDGDDDNDGLSDGADTTDLAEELLFDIGCLTLGQTEVLTFNVTVVCSEAQIVTNTVTVQGTPDGEEPVQDQATSTLEIVLPTLGLEITKVKTAGPDLIEVNLPNPTQFTLLITVSNTGNTDLTNVKVRDVIPGELGVLSTNPSQGTVEIILKGGRCRGKLGPDKIKWAVGDLLAGASATLEIVIETLENPGHGTRYEPTTPTLTFYLNKGAAVRAVDTVTNACLSELSPPVVIAAVGDDDDDDDGIPNELDDDDNGNGIPDDQEDEKKKKRKKRNKRMKRHHKR